MAMPIMWRNFLVLCLITLANGASLRKILSVSEDELLPSLQFDAAVYLEKFGYLGAPNKNGVAHSEFEVKQSISDFQEFNGLKVTGVLDKDTITKMRAPRCGFPDKIRQDASDDDPFSPVSFTLLGTKWNNSVVTWKPVSYSRQLSKQQQISAMQRAFDYWAEVTPLQFEYTDGVPDIEIKFARYSHGDNSPFDGRGFTLAHAYRPGKHPISGDTHFDESEQWTMSGDQGSNLEIVAAHEFGHAIGLGHTAVTDALMAPYYRYTPELKLNNDDIRAAQHLYGANPRVRPTTRRPVTTRRPPTTTTRQPTRRPSYCDMKLDAIDLGYDGAVYGYRKNMIYKMNDNGLVSGYPKPITSVFPKAPSNIRAVAYSPSSRKTYMFKGNSLWRYTRRRLDTGYPKVINTTNFPEKPHAAIWYSDNYVKDVLFLFGHKYFWEWDPELEVIKRTMVITSFWRGVPDSLEAAFQHKDGFIYFFKGMKYRKFNPVYRIVENGYPKQYSAAWFKQGCGNEPR